MGDDPFELAVFLPELDLPLDPALAVVRELGAEYVWFSRLVGERPVAELSDGEIDRIGRRVERHEVDVVVGMLPWHYTNTTGHFREVAERVGSRRIRAMWGPCDNTLSGEWDVATAGFRNIRPYLHSLHCKDIVIEDGLRRAFEYRPLGAGVVDYPTVLQQLRDHRCEAVLSVSTHFRPAGGSRVDAMRINVANLRRLIRQDER
jgi:sugar phosphate isomerase/epimerase